MLIIRTLPAINILQYKQRKAQRKQQALQTGDEEMAEIKHQNKLGLRVIAFSLAFIAVLLFVLERAYYNRRRNGSRNSSSYFGLCASYLFGLQTKMKEEPVKKQSPTPGHGRKDLK